MAYLFHTALTMRLKARAQHQLHMNTVQGVAAVEEFEDLKAFEAATHSVF